MVEQGVAFWGLCICPPVEQVLSFVGEHLNSGTIVLLLVSAALTCYFCSLPGKETSRDFLVSP